MNSTLKLAFGLVIATFAARDLSAQWNIGRSDGPRNFAYAAFGLDPALIASAGYVRTVPLFGHAFEMGGEAGEGRAGLLHLADRVRGHQLGALHAEQIGVADDEIADAAILRDLRQILRHEPSPNPP